MTYIDKHGFSPDERTSVRFTMDPDIAYVMARYRQVHDFWHVLADLPPSLLGEISLKAFEFQVTGLPMCAMSVAIGHLKLTHSERMQLLHVYIPWAIRNSQQCEDLLSFPYEDHLELPVETVRKLLHFEKAPPLVL